MWEEWVQEAYRACESRMTQEGLRRHVLRVLRMWRTWSIFSDDFLNGLQVNFTCFAGPRKGLPSHPCPPDLHNAGRFVVMNLHQSLSL